MSRKIVAHVACVWLVWYASGAASATALWLSMTASAEAVACQCDHEPGAMCPMHATPAGRTECALRNAANRGEPALVSLLGPIGLVSPGGLVLGAHGHSWLEAFVPLTIDRSFSPDAPPPRA